MSEDEVYQILNRLDETTEGSEEYDSLTDELFTRARERFNPYAATTAVEYQQKTGAEEARNWLKFLSEIDKDYGSVTVEEMENLRKSHEWAQAAADLKRQRNQGESGDSVEEDI